MRITPTETFPNEDIHAVLGYIHETTVVSADAMGDMFAAMKNFLGGRVGGYEKMAAKARQQVLEAAVERAREMGANAIVVSRLDVDFSIPEKGGFCFATMTGLAVVSQPRQKHAPSPL